MDRKNKEKNEFKEFFFLCTLYLYLLSIHKVKGVEELILSVEALALYLPPYSPDLNPIEKLWSKLFNFIKIFVVKILGKFQNISGNICF